MKPKVPRYSHRLLSWRKIMGYNQRRLLETGNNSVLTGYTIEQPQIAVKKILFFSDLHWHSDRKYYHSLIDDIIAYNKKYQPDIVIFGGDLTASICYLDEALSAIKKIEAPVKLAISGNWERRRYWISPGLWQKIFLEAGFQMLIQEWFNIDGCAFFGTDDIKKGSPSIPQEFPDGFRILLAHNPDTVINIGRRDIMRKFSLVLCGHTHGGQIRLPGIGAIATSSIYNTQNDYGLFTNSATGTRMIISSGLGYTWVKYRLHCRPEAVLIDFS